MTVPEDPLPFVDAHQVTADAPPEAVWAALVAVLPHAFDGRGATRFARAIGCDSVRRAGRFPATGARLVGFRVTACVPPRALALYGRHRFAAYGLSFQVTPAGAGSSRLAATTHAAFPGLRGRLYRAVVIGSGGHRIVVRRLLMAVRRRAEGRR